MSEDILVPDELIIDFSLTKEEREKKGKEYEDACNKALDSIGKHMFSFDKVKIFNLFADYPYNLTPEEKEIFDKENPYWKEFFKERTK